MATFKLSVLDALNTFTGETLTETGTTVNTHFDVVVTAKTSNDFFIKTVDNTGTAITGVTISIDGSSAGSTDANGYLHLNKATGTYSISASKTNYDTISGDIAHTDTEITGTYIKMYPYTFNRLVIRPADDTITKVYEGQTGEDKVVIINRSSISSAAPTLSDESTGKTEQDIFDDFIAAFSGSNTTDKIIYKPSSKVTKRAYSIAGKRNFSADTRDARSTSANYRGRNRTEKQIVDNFHEIFTGNEIPAEYITNGLVSYYSFASSTVTKDGDNKVSAVTDVQGNHNGSQSTSSAQPTWGSDYKGNISCDGGDDAIVLNTFANMLGTTNQFSISFWVRPESYTTWDTFLGSATNQFWNDGMGFWIGPSYLSFWINSYGNGARFTYTVSSNLNTWINLVGTYDGTLGSANVKIYKNATIGGTTDDFTANVTATSNKIHIGRQNVQAIHSPQAKYDDVMIYNRALTQSDITFNFDQQKGKYGL